MSPYLDNNIEVTEQQMGSVYTRSKSRVTAELTAKVNNVEIRCWTVSVNNPLTKANLDSWKLQQTQRTSMTRRGSGVQIPHGPPQ
jgi:hypothetical protein